MNGETSQTNQKHSHSLHYCFAILSPRELIQTSKRSHVFSSLQEYKRHDDWVKPLLRWQKSPENKLPTVEDDIIQSAGAGGDRKKSPEQTARNPQKLHSIDTRHQNKSSFVLPLTQGEHGKKL